MHEPSFFRFRLEGQQIMHGGAPVGIFEVTETLRVQPDGLKFPQAISRIKTTGRTGLAVVYEVTIVRVVPECVASSKEGPLREGARASCKAPR